jgi:hypothetical protein
LKKKKKSFGGYFDRILFGSIEYAPGLSKWAQLPSDPEGFWGYLTGFFNTYMGLIFTLMM